jgi:3-oxoacyl-[acyl-carrier protein] reductase
MRGKVAIITGSTKGIGLGIAQEFAKQGANLVISARDQKECDVVARKISSKYKVKTFSVACDMSDISQIKNLVDTTKRKFKKLDIFVNNAGIYPFSPIQNIDEKSWDLVLDVNLKGSFFAIKYASEIMKSGSKILIISSIASFVGFPSLSHYCASKGGVNSLVRATALELASKKINVNAIAPGAIETPGATSNMDKSEKEKRAMVIPLKRYGKPSDIAYATAFLCSSKSDYITGQILTIDGGWTIQ